MTYVLPDSDPRSEIGNFVKIPVPDRESIIFIQKYTGSYLSNKVLVIFGINLIVHITFYFWKLNRIRNTKIPDPSHNIGIRCMVSRKIWVGGWRYRYILKKKKYTTNDVEKGENWKTKIETNELKNMFSFVDLPHGSAGSLHLYLLLDISCKVFLKIRIHYLMYVYFAVFEARYSEMEWMINKNVSKDATEQEGEFVS